MTLDKRAVGILTRTFWTPAGWRRDRQTAPEDFAYAKAHGIMFDPIHWTHDESVDLAVVACARLSKQTVVDAFIASLCARRLDLRSALGSYAVGRHLVRHPHASPETPGWCTVCGEYNEPEGDLNVLNFERIKWGGVRHDKPSYIGFDLSRFAELKPPEPSEDDHRVLRAVIDTARRLPAGARLGDLDKALGPILPSNSAERRVLIEILGYCGILVDRAKPDFRERFVPVPERTRTQWSKDDWPFPVQWWTSACGITEAAIDEWFPTASL